jgi:uncharacterized protein (TIGR01244 family)
MAAHFLFRRVVNRLAMSGLCLIALGGAYLGALQVTGNFNTVVAGEFYRSGQLSPGQISNYVKRYGIKTIINLRGDNAGTGWYDAEVAKARQLGVTHIDFGISARRELTSVQVSSLISTMNSAETPILIHCQGGADRSGLASALYLVAIKRVDEQTAEDQLSIRFGHFSLPFIAEYAMNRTFEKFEPTLGVVSR